MGSSGRAAEDFAADYLVRLGFKILAQNWRTKFCEIDIVAERNDRVHFVEVKYRHTSHAGSGIDYVTARKLKQMEFAARAWAAEHELDGDYQLDAIAIDGALKLSSLNYIQNLTG